MEEWVIPTTGYECHNLRGNHGTDFITSPPSAVCFAMCLEFPVPWKQILTRHELLYLEEYLCDSIELEVSSVCTNDGQDCGRCIASWELHCHCPDKMSLQCLSARKVIVGLFREVLNGTCYNNMFWFYREYVNRGMPERLLYTGSVMFRGIHLIFIRILLDSDSIRIRKLNCGACVFYEGMYCNYLILMCKSCKHMSEIQARVCARRTRLVLKRASLLCDGCKGGSLKEVWRQRELLRVMKYGKNVSKSFIKFL
ncbi:E4 ORFD [Mastadenovirus porcusquintum]|uniref:253R protein n=1 Tax=Porcine adenovirus 5 TaxID=45370 RepID=Q98VK6_9ADEN|nr:253R protein [Porcine adenovirus 5]AP_000258.1 E4 ORFD [Porcine mastadenovirus C]AAK00138.1 ORF5 [Porcine adenovirus 5]AAK26498.1 253R protein [Porcine adenovirus 5]